jgi:hypothetical protein
MCQHDAAFSAFCIALRRWLTDSPLLDPPLAAAVELLDHRASARELTWFECEATQAAFYAEDMHAALGASVVLSLWNAARAGSFTVPES